LGICERAVCTKHVEDIRIFIEGTKGQRHRGTKKDTGCRLLDTSCQQPVFIHQPGTLLRCRILLNKELNAQVCDARMLNACSTAG